jgi:NAD(P)-dependent dehydrogenase (short-subunit alcohol dehydrogenase family)
MSRLAGKAAFIIGAGTGIGRASAILSAREGARVAIAEIHRQLRALSGTRRVAHGHWAGAASRQRRDDLVKTPGEPI